MPRASAYLETLDDALADAAGPLSAEELRQVMLDRGEAIGQATVYRLLKRGTEEGRYAAVEMPTGPTRYEPATRPHHHHFECHDCHRVYDVMGCPGHLQKLVPDGFTLESHDLLLHGRCASCAETAVA